VVKEFYRLNRILQTLDLVKAKQKDFGRLNRKEMSVWEAIELLDTVVDDSDPDNENSQIWHALQSGEAAREAGLPRWFVLTTFIHGLGKLLCCFGEPQWAVVGDTFPLGCPLSDQIVFPEFFAEIPDLKVPEYQRPYRIYEPGCGLGRAFMSWGTTNTSARSLAITCPSRRNTSSATIRSIRCTASGNTSGCSTNMARPTVNDAEPLAIPARASFGGRAPKVRRAGERVWGSPGDRPCEPSVSRRCSPNPPGRLPNSRGRFNHSAPPADRRG
jgi:hypothetical protein